MTVRLDGRVEVPAGRDRVWAELTDWEGQARWIPSSTITVTTPHRTGLGVGIHAFHGVRLGPLPLGLVDRFVTTGWREEQEIEVLHLGPVFRGVGTFTLTDAGPGRTTFGVVEAFDLPLALLELPAGLARPLLEAGLTASLRRFARLLERP